MKLEDIPHTVLVASGKGGVGKTTVASDLSRAARDEGYTVGLIDADISTPNSPQVVGGEEAEMDGQRLSTHDAIIPPTVNGVQVVSQGNSLPDDVPVLRDGTWRAEAVADYIGHVDWDDDTDIVVIDTPPGTGEELQVIASEAPPTDAFVVTTPHPSSIRDARKTHQFFDQAGVEHSAILNMAYIPGSDVGSHVLGAVDFTEVDGISESRAEKVRDLVSADTPDLPLFGHGEGEEVPIDMEQVGVVPYTPSYDGRRPSYSEALDTVFAAEEVEA